MNLRRTATRAVRAACALCASFGVLLAAGAAGAQNVPGQPQPAAADTAGYWLSFGGPVQLSYEDSVRVVFMEGGVQIKHVTTTITSKRGKQYPADGHLVLIDSVVVEDGTARMYAGRGEYFRYRSILLLERNIRFIDRGWTVTCDRARYDRQQRIATLTGNVRLADSTRILYADTLVYFRDRESADALGRVVLVDESEDYSIAGRRARYDRARREAVVDRQPVLSFDLAAEEPGTVTSRVMHFDIEREVGIAVGDVRMAKGETRASCDSAAIFNEAGRVELFGNTTAENGPSSMEGPRMSLWFNDDEVTRAVIPEPGRLTQAPKEDSPWRESSWIEGDSIIMDLSNEKVDSVLIVGSSKATYYPAEEEPGKLSNDFSTGRQMFFAFRDGELRYLRIAGEATGLYKFLNLGRSETIDSVASLIDSSLTFKPFATSAERVRYSADTIEYFAATETIRLRGRAKLQYQDKGLTAERIDFDSRANVLDARGIPVIEEAGQKFFGDDMGYDMDTEAGVIAEGSTKYGEAYYRGDRIYKVGKDILKVYRSTYTTCDLEHAHYCFRANRMKVYIRDKIVSGPIFLYIGDIPVFGLPFFASSIKRERSSGFLRPNFDIGLNSREGRFVRGFGYYWATNDYTDFTVITDFNENQSLRVHVGNRYRVRYLLDGDARVDLYRNLRTRADEWMLESNHSQEFSSTASFRSSLKFVSSDNAQQSIDQSEDLRRFVDRRIYSSASFNKSWGGTRLGLSATRNQTLQVTDSLQTRITATMPSFSLSFPRTSLWFGPKHARGLRSPWERVLGGIMFSPNLSANRQTEESGVRERAVITASSSAGFSQQFKLLFVDIGPSMSTRWDFRKKEYDRIPNDSLREALTRNDPEDRSEFSMGIGVGLGTKLYGTFYPRLGPLIGVRHTINPSVNLGFTPKLSKSQSERRSVSFSLRNAVDLKVRSGETEAKKNGFISWNLDGSYNPDAPPKSRFSSIRSSARLNPGRSISFDLNNSYDPYGRRVTYTNMNASLQIGGSFSYPATWSVAAEEKTAAARLSEADTIASPSGPEPGPGPGEEEGGGAQPAPSLAGGEPSPGPAAGGKQSWSLSFGYGYTMTGQGSTRRVDSSVRLAASLALTRGWSVSYSSLYNIEERLFQSQYYSLRRDLHCWQASFSYQLFGDTYSYYFTIEVKAHPEIKYEQGSRGVQSFGGGSSFGEWQ